MPQSQEEQLIINLYRFLMDKGFTYSQLEKLTKANDYAKVLQLAASHYPILKDYGVTPEQFMLTFSQLSLPQAMAALDEAIFDIQYLHIYGISNNEICNLINHFNGLKQLSDIVICHSGLNGFQLPKDDIVRIKALETKIRQWQYRDVDDPQSCTCVDEDSIRGDTQDYVTTAIEGNGLFAERKPPAREALTGGFQCPSLVKKWHIVRF